MPGKFYMLVNPYIEGKTQKIFEADNSLIAAQQAYESVSKYFSNEVPEYHFSLLKLKSEEIDRKNLSSLKLEEYGNNNLKKKYFNKNNFSHFAVSEKKLKNGEVEYKLIKSDTEVKNVHNLINKIIKIQEKYGNFDNENSQSGGSEDNKSGSSGSGSSGSRSSGSESTPSSQSGGSDSGSSRKKSSKFDDDDDDDSPDYYVKKYYYNNPMISYWYYNTGIYDIDNAYIPMFAHPYAFPYLYNFGPTANITL